MKLPTMTALHGVQGDGKGKITLSFKSADGRTHYVPMKVGILNALLAPVVSASKEVLSDEGKTLGLQPLTLTSFRSAVNEDGRAMAQIGLDQMPFRVVLPEGSIPQLINELRKLDDLTKQHSSEKKH